MWKKQTNKQTKDCARSGIFQHKVQHRCFQLWCLPAFITSLLYYVHSKVICAAEDLPKDPCHTLPPPARGVLASHAGVFMGAGISSLPTVGDEIRAPLKTPAWEGGGAVCVIPLFWYVVVTVWRLVRFSAVEDYGSLSPSKTVCKRNETRAILNAEWLLCYASRKFTAGINWRLLLLVWAGITFFYLLG